MQTLFPMPFTSRTIPGLIGLFFFFVAAFDRVSSGQTAVPRPVEVFTEEQLGRKPLNSYGSLEGPIEAMRAYRPLDLNAEAWHKANPGRSHQEWAREARESGAIGTFCLLPGVWNRLDVPDLIAMAAPRACMVVSGTEDLLFPPLGQKE